ncbi:hypothetical protein KUTeg_010934 [Tegillarca granosa]|uniref:Fibrinogen C-terminal domain-containing protein n=1 Tax=Tegillarca granosa TaxID=220873 RepID=A0ABQ9F2M4_TEGGR|nr:hypothetical protein KUTeg_010934 [Tegillarca granosa]
MYSLGYKQNGVYKIYPDRRTGFNVYCDMTTVGGGWTVFQRRFNGKTDFYRTWNAYKQGFGNASEEYWLGNDKIHLLTSLNSYRLRVDLEDFKGVHKYASYTTFSVGSESTGYRLHVNGYSGTAGEALMAHSGYKFTTKDKDQDTYKDNCALVYNGAWWYNKCYSSNLNGWYVRSTKENSSSLNWYYFHKIPRHIPLKTSEMKIKRKH